MSPYLFTSGVQGRSPWSIFVAAALLFLAAFATPASAGQRVALVIGNASYAHALSLANPFNDASDIGAALERLGFEVTLLENADYDAMRRRLRTFTRAATTAEIAIVFCAGHGIEVDKRNFLIPVDARRVKGRRGRGACGKTVDFGIFERQGQVYTEIVPDCSRPTLQGIIRGRVDPSTVINSDGWGGYRGCTISATVASASIIAMIEFGKGAVQINGIEGFWAWQRSAWRSSRALPDALSTCTSRKRNGNTTNDTLTNTKLCCAISAKTRSTR